MTALDWVLTILLAGAALAGLWKGAIKVVFTAGGVGIGAWLAFVEGGAVTTSVAGASPPAGTVVAIRAALFLVPLGLALLAGWGIERTLEALRLGWVNRLAGALLAAAAAALILAALLAVVASASPRVADVCARSKIAGALVRQASGVLPERADEPAAEDEAPPATAEEPGEPSGE